MQSEFMTMKNTKIILLLLTAVAMQACAREDALRTEGLSLGAGDSIARNSALQIIDPWPDGVEDTNLSVPSARLNEKVADADATPIKPQSTTNP
jgi:hypothetical protein